MRKKVLIAFSILLAVFSSCRSYEEFDNNATGNLKALWTILDEHYCFFSQKGIDWNGVYQEYEKKLNPEMTYREYFNICAQMLDTLRDGHVNLSSSFDVSYYRKWWSDYPQDFNLRTLQEYYLKFDYSTVSGVNYKIFPENVAYMYIGSFSTPIGETNLDWILNYFRDCDALIIDIRNNGGGLLTNVETLVSRFINSEICGGYIQHKTGPGHEDFSQPKAVMYKPAERRVMWLDKPIIVLTNRSCFSAANDFISVMKSLPNVIIAGARTGGGSGMPFSSEIPIGWSVRFSACPMTDANGNSTEEGISPSEGYEMHSPDEELARGIDKILDFAVKTALKLGE